MNPRIIAVGLLLLCLPGFAQPRVPTANIRIDASRVENHVSPRMYAAFAEMMAEDVNRGLTAEMLMDRSFEEPANYLGLPAAWRLEPDVRNDNVGAITFSPTTDEAYPKIDQATGAANHSLRVKLAPGDITDRRRGLSEGRLSIRAGVSYVGYVWIKVPTKDGYRGHVRVSLEEDSTDGRTYSETTLSDIAGDWRRYAFTLKPDQTDRFSKLSLLFDGRGTLYLDQISLEPANTLAEIRSDSEAMIHKLRPSFLRWPGGNVAQDYHWQWGIGPRDLRPIWINKAWSNAPEPNDLGTDEYLALCSRLHMEPSITVNVNGGGATPEEAAAWVEYVNGPITSKYGALRAANGHPAPYSVHQWELGNEVFGGWVRGHATADQYALEAVRYARAMRAVDPSIKLIAVGEGVSPTGDAWNSTVLRIAGPEIHFLAIHDYTSASQNSKAPDPRSAMMARAGEFEENYRHIGKLVEQYSPARPIKLIVNEWNLFYYAGVIQSMDGAVYASRMMNGFERDGDIVDANCISDLLNGWVGGTIQASRDRIYGTSQFYAVKLYNDHLGTDRLHLELVSPELQQGLPAVDAVAERSASKSALYIKLSNSDQKRAIVTTINLASFPHSALVELELLAASGPHQQNTFESSLVLLPSRRLIRCPTNCSVHLPANSVAVLTFHRAAIQLAHSRP